MIAVAPTAAAIPSRTCCSEDRPDPSPFDLPTVHDLAARLLGTAKRNGFAARMVAGLFGELTLCGRKRGFARPNQAFRNGPGTLILMAPKRSARVAKQDLNLLVPLTENKRPALCILDEARTGIEGHPASWHIVAFNGLTPDSARISRL